MKTSPKNITELKDNEVFVFGSNKKGNHLSGAAKQAMLWGAIWGQGFGLQGKCFAIPTMDGYSYMSRCVNRFITFASENKDLTFLVTDIGCGIAGYTPKEIAPLFSRAKNVENIHFPESFVEILKTISIYKIACRETGEVIATRNNETDADLLMDEFEQEDRYNKDYVEDFYEIIKEED
jgi:hypothetical protein